MLLLDLDELDSVFARRWFWSTNKFSLASFRAEQHLKSELSEGSLRFRVDSVLKKHGVGGAIGPVRLLTQLTYFGFTMNPVSFFYCYDESGTRVESVIAEVNNTPWGEQHVYVMTAKAKKTCGTEEYPSKSIPRAVFAEGVEKVFHVSPFMSLDMTYSMAFSIPHDRLGVKIENLVQVPLNGAKKILDVSMTMKRLPLSGWNLNRLLLTYPLISFQIFAAIYWHALRLYLKKIPIVSHPGPAKLHDSVMSSDSEDRADSSTSSQVRNSEEPPALASTKPNTALINQ